MSGWPHRHVLDLASFSREDFAAVLELARAHKQAGLRTRVEVPVPALGRPQLTEPRADLEAWGSAAVPHLLSDFTFVSLEKCEKPIGF